MVRQRKRKTVSQGQVSAETLKLALQQVNNGLMSIRSASERFGVSKSTLHRYAKKAKDEVV